MIEQKRLKRRDFLRLSAVAAAGVITAACIQIEVIPETQLETVSQSEKAKEEKTVVKETLTFTPPLTSVSGFVKGREPAEKFAAYLADKSGLAVQAFVPTDYGNTLLGLEQGEYDIVFLPTPFYVKARAKLGLKPGFSVKVNGSTTEQGLILVRADSDIETLSDLKGKIIGAADLESAAGWVVPAAALRKANVDPFTDIDAQFEADDASSIIDLLEGNLDAVFVRPSALTNEKVLEADPDVADKVRTLAEFNDLSIGVIAFRKGLDDNQVKALTAALEAAKDDQALLEPFGWDGLVLLQDDSLTSVQEAAQVLGMVPASN